MSDMEEKGRDKMENDVSWYKDKSLKDLEGCHVFVVYDNGTRVFGCLDRYGCIDPGENANKMFNRVFSTEHQTVAKGVKSVTLLWDEREWEQIDVDDLVGSEIGHNFAVVVNGKLHFVRWYRENDCCFELDDTSSVNIDDLTFGLCRRGLFPAEPGFYQDDDNTPLLKTEDSWSLIRSDFKAIYRLTEKEVYSHLPLTPIHFEPGRDDHE